MVDQVNDYADSRLITGCVYCGGPNETRDHVPSRIFLDAPFPTNLPVVPSCRRCNISFSRDEEYLACLLEAVIAGSTSPEDLERVQVADLLRRSPALRSRIDRGRRQEGPRIRFDVESERIRSVLLKLARGHAAFELSAICREEPTTLVWRPMMLMTADELDAFDASHVTDLFGEVGSRGTQRLLVTQVVLRSVDGGDGSLNLLINDWVDVQQDRYRYLAIDESDIVTVKIVLREYLACEISWAK